MYIYSELILKTKLIKETDWDNEDNIESDRISHKTTASSCITQLDRDNKIITLSIPTPKYKSTLHGSL